MRFLFFAYLLFLMAGVEFLVNYGLDFYPLGVFFILASFGTTSYAITRYQLMDIEVIVKKTLVFAGVFSMVMGVVAVVTGVSQNYLARYFAINPALSTIVCVALAILLYDPTRGVLVRLTDRYLFQKKEDFRKVLNRLSNQIITILDLEKVGKTILATLESSLRLEAGAIVVKNENGENYPLLDSFGFKADDLAFSKESPLIRYFSEREQILNLENEEEKRLLPESVREPLEQMGTRICLPLFIHSELIGLLTLGKKKSDEGFKRDETDYFPTLSGQAAIALSNARLYDILKKSEIDFAQQAKMAAIGTLSAGIGHEVKNPLAAIRIGAEMIQFNKKRGVYKEMPREQYEAVVDDVLQRIIQNVERATGVMERLSSFAKKPKEIKIENVNLEECVDAALSLLKQEFQHYDIVVEKEVPADLPYALADKVQMEDIFLNLLVNARHAIKEKGQITILGYARDGEVEIAVKDTGSGIPKENLEKIFDPFFTTKDVSRNPDKEAIRGTGLGLFLVREFIKKFGGRITVESEAGQGSAFHIFLKAAQ
jgi:signal transduction histidine kinase